MKSLLSNYSESTKSMSTTLFVALGLILVSTFIPQIRDSFFKSTIFKVIIFACLAYTSYNILSSTIPLIKEHNIDLLRSSLINLTKSISYNLILFIFILILAYHVIFI